MFKPRIFGGVGVSAFLLLVSASTLLSQNVFERGQIFYDQRAADADSFRANPTNIDKAIEAFRQSLDQDIKSEQAAAYLLRSYYFKGMYTGLPQDQQREVHNKGRTLGEEMMDRFPDSAPIKFWFGANLGRWANTHGFVKAATSGTAKKLRRICKDIIKLDMEYQGGGGYRILAQVHLYSPSIPLVMGWPSDDKALEFAEKAIDITSDHPPNRLLYAQILIEFDRMDDARRQLNYLLDMEPRSTHIVEDRYIKHRSRQLLNDHF